MLPLFPLQTVLLPGALLPLHIFEPRYRQLTVDLVQETVPDRCFGVVAIRDTWAQEIEAPDQLHEIGCSTLLREAKQLPDGRFDIVTTGQRRFRILDIDTDAAPYLMAEVDWIPDEALPEGSEEAAVRLAEATRATHRRYCQAAWERKDWNEPDADTDVASLAYLLAADCLLAMPDRQRLLEETQPLRRLRMVCRILAMEAGFLNALRAVPTHTSELSSSMSLN
ncbi:MAG: peptidase [Pseudonocardiaceae bacterium]|nr:peptidase [Pseudonocardiaceae bacterium]